jgi:hypothetical protein
VFATVHLGQGPFSADTICITTWRKATVSSKSQFRPGDDDLMGIDHFDAVAGSSALGMAGYGTNFRGEI